MGFVFVGFRAVRGVVVDGDAPGSEDHHESRGGVSGPCVRPLCHPHRVHPTSHGRLISVPPRSPTSLVSLIIPTDLDVHNNPSYSGIYYKYCVLGPDVVLIVAKQPIIFSSN